MTGWRKTLQSGSLRLLESRWYWASLVAGIFASFAIWCSRNRLAGDVAWYLYAVQRLRAGAILYKDIHDMNPPAVYLMYMPLGWVHQLSGIPIDRLLYSAILSVTAIIMVLIWRIPDLSYIVRSLLALAVAFAALSVDRLQLGQRDPLCALLFTGLMISTYLRIQKPDERSHWPSTVAVLAAGFGLAMKPHFLAAWVLLVAVLIWHLGLRRALLVKETWLPLLVSAVSWIVTAVAFPDYVTMLQIASRYYGNMNVSGYEFSPLIIPLAIAAIALLRTPEPAIKPLIQLSALATIGFAASCIVQRKGFAYHMAPAMFWGTVTACLLLADVFERRTRRPASWWMATVTVLASLLLPALSIRSALLPVPTFFAPTSVEEFVKEHAQGKVVLSLSTDLRTGFPLILEAGAVNARPDAQLWALGELYRDQVIQADDANGPVAAKYHTRPEMSADERQWFDQVVDIVSSKHPAIILIQTADSKWGLGKLKFDFIDYFSTDDRFREALRSYVPGPSNNQRRVLTLDGANMFAAGVQLNP